jgi:hypothetical protein
MFESPDEAAARAIDHLRNDTWKPALDELRRLAAELS